MKNVNWQVNTEIVHTAQGPSKEGGMITQGLYPAVGYAFQSIEHAEAVVSGKEEGVHYGRYGNPTLKALEEKVAALEGGEAGLGLSSGMAAISSALLAFLKQGDHVICTKDIYGNTFKFLNTMAPRFGITSDFVDCTNSQEVEKAIRENTKVLFIETPSNPVLTVLDIEKLAIVAHKHGLKVIIDSTFMTPYLQKPLELGADLVVHSATKYLNGHGDVLAGIIVGSKKDVDNIRKNFMADLGQSLSAWDAFLVLRGLKTLGLRMEKHCQTALEVAEFLSSHPAIKKVYYPGLTTHPQYEVAQKQMKHSGGIVSFEVKGGLSAAKEMINALKLAFISFSLGDPETLVQHPASMTHAAIPAEERAKSKITDELIRLSVGLEDAKDIIDDLEQALSKAY
ncbi:aminotransferase class I/II-fold pyridoxal phosphate-dependent enzyme [Sporosarcina limicola]|uniref:aminotransferase class I/II-fold pyridoxal phosphate-dependent enzyme n=1 Tax=Sporosarcina limicola TaxID=34101 RepID=UPI00178A4031